MNQTEFESILTHATRILRERIRSNAQYKDPAAFEDLVRTVLSELTANVAISVKKDMHAHAFPDIAVNGYGVEVKSTRQDSWRATANSILETMREESAREIYVIFGKMGGRPDVRWSKYEDCVYHVRISHAPRFCVEMNNEEKSLFSKIGISYEEFSALNPEEKMARVRQYARTLLGPGERLWWLEEKDHAIEMHIRRFSDLEPAEKIKMRAEAAVLCPQIVAPSRTPHKYDAAFHFLISHHGILAARDMFTAGSVGMKDGMRGGSHIKRQFADIERQMVEAFKYLPSSLLKEYWEKPAVPMHWAKRLAIWMDLADKHACKKWRPSKVLFKDI